MSGASDHVTKFCELHRFMNMYNYFLKARVSLRILSSLVINLFTQVAIVLELALVSSQNRPSTNFQTCHGDNDALNVMKPGYALY
jgi:hypothetical protein